MARARSRVLSGVWAVLRTEREAEERSQSVKPWFLHGAALAMLPWMHTRFAVLAAGLAALILLRLGRTPNALAKAGALVVVPVISALCWIGYFVKIYGTADPAAPYGGEPGSFAFVYPTGLPVCSSISGSVCSPTRRSCSSHSLASA